MTPEQLERAKSYAQKHYADQSDNGLDIDWESTTYSEGEDGCWVKAWVFVPREAHQDGEAGSEVVSGG